VNRYNILVVDDEPANLYLLEEVLSEYNITSVKNSSDMFIELAKNIPDIILLDIMMPGVDGLTIAYQLKENIQFSNIPVIFISAKDSGEDVAEGLNTGADDYIKKPFNNTELIARISRVFSNIEKNKELYNKATRDSLTGLFNRDYFFEYLSIKTKQSERDNLKFSAGILDIDHFKNVNDTWGHQIGDRILIKLTQTVNRMLRSYDIFARYGGEEFVFLIDGILKNEAKIIIDRIREQVAASELDIENHITVTFSCGLSDISEITDRENISDLLLKSADQRLYKAKNSGRNMVVSED